MDYGKKIAALRKAHSMTQEELGKVLSVTYQAVSKWERGESLPDFDTMSRIAKYFKVPLSYFDDGEDTVTEEETTKAEVKAEIAGVCTHCGKMLTVDEVAQKEPKILCKPCFDRLNKEAADRAAALEEKARKEKEKEIYVQRGHGFDLSLAISLVSSALFFIVLMVLSFKFDKGERLGIFGLSVFFIPLAVFGAVQALCDFIKEEKNLTSIEEVPEGYTRNLSLIVAGAFSFVNIACYTALYVATKDNFCFLFLAVGAVMSFTFVSQFLWGGLIKKIFTAGGFTFSLPGFIFSLDIESIAFMIIAKFLLGVLSAIVFIATTALVAGVAMLVSVFYFVPSIIYKSVKDKKVETENR